MRRVDVHRQIIAALNHMQDASPDVVRVAVTAELSRHGEDLPSDAEVNYLIDRVRRGPRVAGIKLISRQFGVLRTVARELRSTPDLDLEPQWMEIPATAQRVSGQLGAVHEMEASLPSDTLARRTVERIIRDVADKRDAGEAEAARTADCWLQAQSDDSIVLFIGTEQLCVLPGSLADEVRPVIDKYGGKHRKIWIDGVLRGSQAEDACYTVWIPILD